MLKQSTKLVDAYDDEDLVIPWKDVALYMVLSVVLSVAVFMSTRA
jgi:hypothetical protein